MKLRTLKLGITVKDNPTGISGMLLNRHIDSGLSITYSLQPKGLNDDGEPINKIGVEVERLSVTDEMYEEIEVPTEILGTQVTDKATGYTGTAIGLYYHINGCFHVVVQAQGFSKRTGKVIAPKDFDLRQCEGPMVPKFKSEAELAESKVQRPSPTGGVPDIVGFEPSENSSYMG